ncbi:MAG: DUF2141 domain-containing protein [Parvibaculum sp.]|nr:DUF2141 domain-containing protein [Parvibaculum sp.]
MTSKFMTGLVLAALAVMPAHAGDLKLTVVGVRSDDGALMIGFYDSAAKFEKAIDASAHVGLLSDKGRLIGATMRTRTGMQGIGFLRLPPGRYAVIVFHDENDNALLDMNALGIPIEGYGFSNNASGFFSAPSFDAAAVTVGSGETSISIALNYQVGASLRPSLRR